MTLYTYRSADAACTPFATDDPVIAAGLYADENGSGQVFVIVGDWIEEYDSSGECDAWEVECVRSHRSPLGWTRPRFETWARPRGWSGNQVHAIRGRVAVDGIGGRVAYTLESFGAAIDSAKSAEAEAVLRMAAHVAWGERSSGEVRDA